MSTPVPYDEAAERAVVGALLLYGRSVGEVYDTIDVKDFYTPAYAIMYDAARSIYLDGGAPDPISIANIIEQQGKIDAAGGKANIATIPSSTVSRSHAIQHAHIVKSMAIRRRLMTVGQDITELAHHSSLDIEDVLSISEKAVMDVATHSSDKGKLFIPASISTASQEFGDLWMNGTTMRGLSTGFTELDRLISGLERTKFYLVAARPAMGKTAFALNIASHVALTSEKPVLFFSLEMSDAEISQRLTQALAKISKDRLEGGLLTQADWRRIADSAIDLDASRLLIDDDAAITVDELYTRCRRAKAEHGELGLVVIDYIQLMSGKGENRQLEISNISRRLKVLAKELDVAVIGLSQLSRNLESRLDKRPMLSDLRESGSLEQDANTVMFIYRDEIYNPDSLYRGMPEIIISKQRSGPTGMTRMAFVDEQVRFANLSREA